MKTDLTLKFCSIITASLVAGVTLVLMPGTAVLAATTTIAVSGTQWGSSTCYIGATEGSARFDIDDLTDLGINTFRMYGGASRWEQQDDDGVLGSPDIPTIKANVNSINWAWWDNAMTNPPQGSDYYWAVNAAHPELAWHGNARTILSALKTAGIRVVMTLRPMDNNNTPAWATVMNPPSTQAGKNEWWEHVFATVYWMNVRNDYGVDDWEVHNEPDNSSQGWRGSEADYESLIMQTQDAIAYVYATYLPARTYRIYAPQTTGGSSWPKTVMADVGAYFDSVDVHDYDADITKYVQKVHGWMNTYNKAAAPLWLSEWATYTQGDYAKTAFNVGTVINNLIRGSQPGSNHVYGSHIFSMYDWLSGNSGRLQNFDGLVDSTGARRPGYYAFRLAVRGLQGCRPTFQSTAGNSNLLAITTRDASGNVYVLVTNSASSTVYTVDANVSALISSATGTMWQYDATHADEIVSSPALSNGHVTFTIPGTAAVLLKFGGVTAPTATPTNTPPVPTATSTAVATAATRTNTPLSSATPTATSGGCSGTTNLVLNKPVVVTTSVQSGDVGQNAIDGSTNSRWWTLKRSTLPEEYIVVDLGSSMTFCKAMLFQGDRYATAWNIQVSSDNVNWTAVFSTTSSVRNGWQTVDFGNAIGRYVKYDTTAWFMSSDRTKTYELQLYGP